MATATTYKGVLSEFKKKSPDIQAYFPDFETLLTGFAWDVSFSYVFARVEGVKHWVVYCGILKLHRTDAELTKTLVDRDYMSRSRFKDLFKTVYGQPLPIALLGKLSSAEAVRDRYTHGKILEPTGAQSRQALIDVFEFAEEFSVFVEGIAGFRPFGDLRGIRGRTDPLSKETTRWVLKGMGIPKVPAEE